MGGYRLSDGDKQENSYSLCLILVEVCRARGRGSMLPVVGGIAAPEGVRGD